MEIRLNNVVLCAGDARDADGSPSGPDGLDVRVSPGTEDYEYLGAGGIGAEHVGCDRTAVSFGVTRTYATAAAAQAAAVALVPGTPREGALRDLDIRQTGCSLTVRYSVEGF